MMFERKVFIEKKDLSILFCSTFLFFSNYSKINIFCVYFLFFDLNRTNSVSFAFGNILLALSHITIFFRSKLIFLVLSFRDLLEYRKEHLHHQQRKFEHLIGH